MRRYSRPGTCAACQAAGPVWYNDLAALDFGGGLVLEADTTLPELCDACATAQARYDAWQYLQDHPDSPLRYPYAEPPPAVPPWRRPPPGG